MTRYFLGALLLLASALPGSANAAAVSAYLCTNFGVPSYAAYNGSASAALGYAYCFSDPCYCDTGNPSCTMPCGNITFPSCSSNPSACNVTGCTNPIAANGASRPGPNFVAAAVTSPGTCTQGSCTCVNGVWTGACYTACTISPPVLATTYTYTVTDTVTTTQTTTVTNSATGTSSATGTCSTAGQLMWNNTDGKVEVCNGSGWLDPTAGGTGQSCTGSKGKFQFSPGGGNDFLFCDGTNWTKMSGGNIGACPGSDTGKLTYDASVPGLKMCDGNNWRKIGSSGGGGGTVTMTTTSITTSISTVTSPVMCGGKPNCAAWCSSVGSTVQACPQITPPNPIICVCANSQYTACAPNCQ